MTISGKNLLSIADLSAEDVGNLIHRAAGLKRRDEETRLKGKVLALLFEKPSLRTRVSFEVAMLQLGGHALYLSPNEVGLGKREQIPDVARTLSRYVDVIASRTFSQQTLELMAHYAGVPVINALSDREHPCQALADLLTISEKKNRLKGLKLAYVGDGNNVARSLVFAASLAGVSSAIATPTDYGLDDETLYQAREIALNNEAEIFIASNPQEAVTNADIIYTDVWTSMGQEDEADVRRHIFAPYQVNSSLLSMAREDAIFMHPLPAHHGEEIADGLLEHPRSVVFDQAENRLHIQKAILAGILGE